MVREHMRFPDERAVARVLNRRRGTGAEVILRLAWDLGLTREEMCRLKWADVAFGENTVALPDRTVPMEGAVRRCLWERREACGGASEYVVISDQRLQRMYPESVSRIARSALDKEPALAGIRLIDLRYGFILRQISGHGWPYAARVSGLQAVTMQAAFLPAVKSAGRETKPAVKPASDAGEETVGEIIRREGASPAGLALRMAWELEIPVRESIALTWEQIDFAGGVIRLSGREVPMGGDLAEQLAALHRSRGPEADPHVLLTPRSMRPYDRFGISRVLRTVLIRGGTDATLQDLLHRQAREKADAAVLRFVEAQGSVSRREVAEALHLEKDQAIRQLRRLTEEKRLVRIGAKYYLYGAVVSPEEQYGMIRAYLKSSGTAFRKDLSELLRIEARPCSWLLHTLVRQGKLVKTGQLYSLPPETEPPSEK